MFKRFVLFIVLVFVFAISSNAQVSVDAELTKCLGERYHDLSNNSVNEMAVFHGFEDKLIEAGILQDNTQESYVLLMANLLNDDIEIPVSEWGLNSPNLDILSMPSNLATSMLCFSDVYETEASSLAESSSLVAMNPYLKNILAEYDLGNKLNNIRLVRSVNDEDFSKMIYKAPILVLLHNIASYKAESNQLTSNY